MSNSNRNERVLGNSRPRVTTLIVLICGRLMPSPQLLTGTTAFRLPNQDVDQRREMLLFDTPQRVGLT